MAKSKKQNKKTSFKIPEEKDSEPQVHAADLGQYSDQRNQDEHEAAGSEEEPEQASDENDDEEEDQDYNPTTEEQGSDEGNNDDEVRAPSQASTKRKGFEVIILYVLLG